MEVEAVRGRRHAGAGKFQSRPHQRRQGGAPGRPGRRLSRRCSARTPGGRLGGVVGWLILTAAIIATIFVTRNVDDRRGFPGRRDIRRAGDHGRHRFPACGVARRDRLATARHQHAVRRRCSAAPALSIMMSAAPGLGRGAARPCAAGRWRRSSCSAFAWLKAPTREGRAVMDQIEGLRLYLGTAEEERLEYLHAAREDAGTVRALPALCGRARRRKQVGRALRRHPRRLGGRRRGHGLVFGRARLDQRSGRLRRPARQPVVGDDRRRPRPRRDRAAGRTDRAARAAAAAADRPAAAAAAAAAPAGRGWVICGVLKPSFRGRRRPAGSSTQENCLHCWSPGSGLTAAPRNDKKLRA